MNVNVLVQSYWFRFYRSFTDCIFYLVKKCKNYDGACKVINKKKILKKQRVCRNKKLYCLLLFSDVIIQTNKFFIFRYLLSFTTKYIGGQIKAFSFLLFHFWCEKYRRWIAPRYRVIAKQRAKREQTQPV